MGALVVIMAVNPWRTIDAASSPFIGMFTLAGLGIAAVVINLVVLTSAASSANSGIYSTSRMVYGLAQDGNAPKAFGKLSIRKVPQNALLFSCIFLLAGLVLLYSGDSVIGAFTMVTSVASVLHHVRLVHDPDQLHRVPPPPARAARGLEVQDARLGFMPYVVLAFFGFMLVALAQADDTRLALLRGPALVPAARRGLVLQPPDAAAAGPDCGMEGRPRRRVRRSA